MRVIIIGCEYTGTTTLGYGIQEWATQNIGGIEFGLVHDHWKIPHTINHPSDMTDEEQAQYMALSPRIKEAAQRHNLYYHTIAKRDTDGIVVGYYFEDSIYAPLYYGYGGEGGPGDRVHHSQMIEERNLEFAPETVLVLVKASPEVLRRRMNESPHQRQVIEDKDIELVLQSFEEAFEASTIPQKITLDTSEATPEKTLAEFVDKVEPYLTERDRSRMAERAG